MTDLVFKNLHVLYITTNYQPLQSLARNLGCSFLSAINVARMPTTLVNALRKKKLEILAHQIENKQLGALSNSRFYALMIEESTDISVTKQLVIYGRYVSEKGGPCTTFLKVQDLVDGIAARIEEALRFSLWSKTATSLLRITIKGQELENFDFEKAVNTWGARKNRKITIDVLTLCSTSSLATWYIQTLQSFKNRFMKRRSGIQRQTYIERGRGSQKPHSATLF